MVDSGQPGAAATFPHEPDALPGYSLIRPHRSFCFSPATVRGRVRLAHGDRSRVPRRRPRTAAHAGIVAGGDRAKQVRFGPAAARRTWRGERELWQFVPLIGYSEVNTTEVEHPIAPTTRREH